MSFGALGHYEQIDIGVAVGTGRTHHTCCSSCGAGIAEISGGTEATDQTGEAKQLPHLQNTRATCHFQSGHIRRGSVYRGCSYLTSLACVDHAVNDTRCAGRIRRSGCRAADGHARSADLPCTEWQWERSFSKKFQTWCWGISGIARAGGGSMRASFTSTIDW